MHIYVIKPNLYFVLLCIQRENNYFLNVECSYFLDIFDESVTFIRIKR